MKTKGGQSSSNVEQNHQNNASRHGVVCGDDHRQPTLVSNVTTTGPEHMVFLAQLVRDLVSNQSRQISKTTRPFQGPDGNEFVAKFVAQSHNNSSTKPVSTLTHPHSKKGSRVDQSWQRQQPKHKPKSTETLPQKHVDFHPFPVSNVLRQLLRR